MRKRTRFSYQQASANNQPLCERLRDALRRMRIVRTELQAWNGVSDRLSFFRPRRWLDPHYALPAGLGEEQWGASELRAYTVPPRSAMSGGRTGTRSARAKPCSDFFASRRLPIAGTHERSATKVFRAGLSTPGHPSTAQWDDVSCWHNPATPAESQWVRLLRYCGPSVVSRVNVTWLGAQRTIERCYTLTSRRACAGRDCGVEWVGRIDRTRDAGGIIRWQNY